MAFLESFIRHFSLKDFADISIVSILIYQFVMIIRGTRAAHMILGVVVLGLLFSLGISYKLYALNWILENFFESFFVIVIIVFQDQVRTALANFGARGLKIFGNKEQIDSGVIDEVVSVASELAQKKIGALIVFEREQGLLNYINTGTRLDAKVHMDLIYSIFDSTSPMHDGAVIIAGGRIASAGSYLPLTKKTDVARELGTRHRAAIGLTELTDAVVVIVSEERGNIKVSTKGNFKIVDSMVMLREILSKELGEARFLSEENARETS